MNQKIHHILKEVLEKLGIGDTNFILEHPEDLRNGDYFTNVAMACAKKLGRKPNDIAKEIVAELEKNLPQKIERIEVVGGFINFYLARGFFADEIEKILSAQGGSASGGNNSLGKNNSLEGKKIMIDYTQPNPFKPFHIGHLMSNAIGESISRILEHSGADVTRANYQGDVGLHVAKAIWGIMDKGLPDSKLSNKDKAQYIGECYSFGATVYEEDPKAKGEIDEINKKIYDHSDAKINELYTWGFEITMEAFEDLYKTLGTKFDYYFLESQMSDIGREIVNANLGKIFEKSDGAIVFKGEKYDPKLHTRVFITSQNLPTYEAKELGLTLEKFKTVPNMDLSIVETAVEQAEYMKVVTKAISLINPEFGSKMKHITHGMMRLAGGKMSSRKGNVVTGESLIQDTIALVQEKLKERDWNQEEKDKVAEMVGVAALKYSILKQGIGGDIIYDFEKSISFEGDSGPYLQYSYARANSVLEKAQRENILPGFENVPDEIFELEKMLYKFTEIVLRSAKEYEPHYIANYLIEVARSFNSFYGNNLIVDKADKHSSYKVALTYAFSFTLKTGLSLLGIQAPKKM